MSTANTTKVKALIAELSSLLCEALQSMQKRRGPMLLKDIMLHERDPFLLRALEQAEMQTRAQVRGIELSL